MKSKFLRTKQFVQNHKTGIAAGAGVVVGAGIAVVVYSKIDTVYHVTNEQLEHLMQNPEVALKGKGSLTKSTYWITTVPCSKS